MPAEHISKTVWRNTDKQVLELNLYNMRACFSDDSGAERWSIAGYATEHLLIPFCTAWHCHSTVEHPFHDCHLGNSYYLCNSLCMNADKRPIEVSNTLYQGTYSRKRVGRRSACSEFPSPYERDKRQISLKYYSNHLSLFWSRGFGYWRYLCRCPYCMG